MSAVGGTPKTGTLVSWADAIAGLTIIGHETTTITIIDGTVIKALTFA